MTFDPVIQAKGKRETQDVVDGDGQACLSPTERRAFEADCPYMFRQRLGSAK